MRKPKIVTAVVIGGRTYRSAKPAAEAWALHATGDWWTKAKGSKAAACQRYGRPIGYDKMTDYNNTMYRRVLPIFKRILP